MFTAVPVRTGDHVRTTEGVVPSCPRWCSCHYEPSSGEALHQHDFVPVWGGTEEKVRIGLVRYDANGYAGSARIDIQYLSDGVSLDGSASLMPEEARSFALAILAAIEVTEKPAR